MQSPFVNIKFLNNNLRKLTYSLYLVKNLTFKMNS